jgi:peroxiredoxin
MSDLSDLGVHVAAVCVDPPEKSKPVVENNKLTFPILADKRLELIRALDLEHKGGGPGGTDIAMPANMLMDAHGRVLWSYVSTTTEDRLAPQVVLEHVRSAIP